MRLVDDRQVARRDDLAEAALSHGGVRAEQVVVDDDDVRLGGRFTHARDEARGKHGAVPSEALLARRGHVGPKRQVIRQVVDFCAIARLGVARPLRDALEPGAIGRRQTGGRLAQPLQPVKAEIVGAPLHVCGAHVVSERAPKGRQVLVEDLVLKRTGARGNEHPPPGERCRHEIRECLACAGAGFRDERAAAVERARDFGGQRALPVTSFELIDGRGERPVGVEHAIDARG